MHEKRHEKDEMISALVFIGHRERIDSEWWLGSCLKEGDILIISIIHATWIIMEHCGVVRVASFTLRSTLRSAKILHRQNGALPYFEAQDTILDMVIRASLSHRRSNQTHASCPPTATLPTLPTPSCMLSGKINGLVISIVQ